jgi:hypothetical protein
MADVLICDFDPLLVHLLSIVLDSEGHYVARGPDLADPDEAVADIRMLAAPTVLLIKYDPYYRAANARLLEAADAGGQPLRRHAYVFYGVNVDDFAQQQRQLVFRLAAWLIPMPFDLQVMIDTVAEAARRFAP